jgi:predicted dehydrogenase
MHLTRRQFAAAAAFTPLAPSFVQARNAADKLNIALVGSGGRGMQTFPQFAGENIVAVCDIDSTANERAIAKAPGAKPYRDFRKLFDDAKSFDAVVVSTTEHTHYHAVMLALKAGKHVYCEKPLSYNIEEARKIRLEAAKVKVATQMGNQMHASDNMRQCVELVRSGLIGGITEVHVWVSRAWGLQSEEAAKRNKDIVVSTDSFREKHAVPGKVDWDLWIAGAPYRDFNNVYLPGPKWYRFWDFANGTMSDLGSHWNDLPFWALDLKSPTSVEAFGPKAHPDLAPATMTAVYDYPARGEQPALKFTWYQGEDKPTLWKEKKIPQWQNGVLFVGAKGMILYDYSKHIVLPEADFKDFKRPAQVLPRMGGAHQAEWIAACKTGSPTLSNFAYAGLLTEANHLGNVAYRAGKKLLWDHETMTATNAPEAAQYIRRDYRPGWAGLV